jgi:hypothetical protein
LLCPSDAIRPTCLIPCGSDVQAELEIQGIRRGAGKGGVEVQITSGGKIAPVVVCVSCSVRGFIFICSKRCILGVLFVLRKWTLSISPYTLWLCHA